MAFSSPSASVEPFGPLTVIADPAAGEGSVYAHLPALQRALGHRPYTLHLATSSAHTSEIAREALEGGRRFVVAVGDDGTVHDVLNGMFRDGATIVDRPVLGVVSAGSGCELIRSFGLPDDDIVRSVRHLDGDTTYALDVMKVTTTDRDGALRTEYAHNVALIGLRAGVANRRRGGNLGRFVGFWTAYARHGRRHLTVRVDTKTHELDGWDVIIGNGQFGGGMRLSPRSYPGDGVLDALVSTGPKADAYRLLPKIFMNGSHLPDPGVKELRAKIRVAIDADRPMPVVVDGRAFGSTPATFQILASQLLLKL